MTTGNSWNWSPWPASIRFDSFPTRIAVGPGFTQFIFSVTVILPTDGSTEDEEMLTLVSWAHNGQER